MGSGECKVSFYVPGDPLLHSTYPRPTVLICAAFLSLHKKHPGFCISVQFSSIREIMLLCRGSAALSVVFSELCNFLLSTIRSSRVEYWGLRYHGNVDRTVTREYHNTFTTPAVSQGPYYSAKGGISLDEANPGLTHSLQEHTFLPSQMTFTDNVILLSSYRRTSGSR